MQCGDAPAAKCVDPAPGIKKSQEHIDNVNTYVKQQEIDLQKRKAEYQKLAKEANTALHSKMITLEDNVRKEMHDQLAKQFGPNPKQVAVGEAIKDFNEGRTSQAASKVEKAMEKDSKHKDIKAKAEKKATDAGDAKKAAKAKANEKMASKNEAKA